MLLQQIVRSVNNSEVNCRRLLVRLDLVSIHMNGSKEQYALASQSHLKMDLAILLLGMIFLWSSIFGATTSQSKTDKTGSSQDRSPPTLTAQLLRIVLIVPVQFAAPRGQGLAANLG